MNRYDPEKSMIMTLSYTIYSAEGKQFQMNGTYLYVYIRYILLSARPDINGT